MYLTAQHVRTPTGDREGINAYVYVHRGEDATAIDWGRPDVARIVDENPGELLLDVEAVPRQQNFVLSYLDVVAPEGMPYPQLAAELDRAVALYNGENTWHSGGIALRFYVARRLLETASSELHALKKELRLVLNAGLIPGSRHNPSGPAMPLRATVEPDEVGVRLRLEAESRRRLEALLPDRTIPMSLGVPREFEEHFGEGRWEHYAGILTHLTMDGLNAFAGLVFLDREGNVVWDSRHGRA